DEDIVAAFKLVNPTIKLPSCHKLSGSILKKENAKDISLERSCTCNISSFTERYIEDLAMKDINVIGVVSDSAEENVKSQHANLYMGNIFKSSERYKEILNKAIKIIGYFDTSTYFLGQLHNRQMHLYNGKAYALTSP
ncbi:14163_t:CDS:2, partial [Dentiscutata heterogama]